MSADSRNWSVPNGVRSKRKNSSIHWGGRWAATWRLARQPTNLVRLLENDGHQRKEMAEMHEPHKWKTNKNGLKRCLRSTPFVYLIKSIFWSSQRVSCHRIPIFPLYFFIHLIFFFQISKFARDVTRSARRLFVAIKKSGKLAREYSWAPFECLLSRRALFRLEGAQWP